MRNPTTSALLLGLTVLGSSVFSLFGTAACGDDANKLTATKTGDGTAKVDDTSDGGLSVGAAQAAAEAQFRALQADLDRTCGNVCHKAGATMPTPPTFLGGADPYISVKAYKGIVVKDPTQSILWNKIAHTGPAIADTADLQKKVQAWLTSEAIAIVVDKKPTTAPALIVSGPNDIDMTPTCTGGLTGVHLKFTASIVGTHLSLADVKLVVPAGSDAHFVHPVFYKKLATPKADGTDEVVDPQDSLSNLDVQLPNGAETALAAGIDFTGDGWKPFDFAVDKIRIDVDKLEPGKVKEAGQNFDCKDPAGFVTKILPSMSGQGGVTPNCTNCHNQNNATAQLNLTQQTGGALDAKFVCSSVFQKINKGDFANSLIIKKVSGGGVAHGGGQVNNAATWAKLFTDNQAVFF